MLAIALIAGLIVFFAAIPAFAAEDRPGFKELKEPPAPRGYNI